MDSTLLPSTLFQQHRMAVMYGQKSYVVFRTFVGMDPHNSKLLYESAIARALQSSDPRAAIGDLQFRDSVTTPPITFLMGFRH